MSIPLVDGNERVDLWHPALYARVEALCADPRMEGQLRVESAVRTYAEQHYLYVNQNRPGFNLAADPDRAITPAYGLSRAQGSWHMAQPDGHGYACDFLTSALSAAVHAALPVVAAEYRLVQTVLHAGISNHPSPPAPLHAIPANPRFVKEWWHFQPPLDEGPLSWVPDLGDVMSPEQEKKLDALASAVKALGKRLTDVEIRTDLILDHLEGRKPSAEGAGPRSMMPHRDLVRGIAKKVGAPSD